LDVGLEWAWCGDAIDALAIKLHLRWLDKQSACVGLGVGQKWKWAVIQRNPKQFNQFTLISFKAKGLTLTFGHFNDPHMVDFAGERVS